MPDQRTIALTDKGRKYLEERRAERFMLYCVAKWQAKQLEKTK